MNFVGNRPFRTAGRKVVVAGGLLRSIGLCVGAIGSSQPVGVPAVKGMLEGQNLPSLDPNGRKGYRWCAITTKRNRRKPYDGEPISGFQIEEAFSTENDVHTNECFTEGNISAKVYAARALCKQGWALCAQAGDFGPIVLSGRKAILL